MTSDRRFFSKISFKAFVPRAISLATDLMLAAPFFLIPLLFSSKGTHTIVIKEIVFQALTWNLALLAPLALWLERRESVKPPLPLALPALMASLALWLYVSAYVLAPHPRAQEAFTTWLAYLMFAGLAATLARSPRRFRLCVFSALVSSALVSVYAILQAFEIDWFYVWGAFTWDDSEVRRVTGSLGNPDYLASYLAALIPLTLAAAFSLRGMLRGAASGLLLLQFVALFFTYSRGGLLALTLSLALFAGAALWLYRRSAAALFRSRTIRNYLLGAAATALVLALSAGLFVRDEAAAWGARLLDFGRDQAGVTRVHFYRGALNMWMDQPIQGHGLGMFDVMFPQYRPLELSDIMPFREYRVEHAHNEFLQIGAETGAVGLALYLALFGLAAVWALGAAGRVEPRLSLLMLGLLFAIAATFIHNFFTVTLRYTASAFLIWGFLGLIVGQLSRLRFPEASGLNRMASPAIIIATLAAAPVLLHDASRYYAGDWLTQEGKETLAGVSSDMTRGENRAQLENALTQLHRAKALTPAQVEIYFYLGLAYNQIVFDYIQAREIYEELEELYPNFTATRLNLGVTAIDQAEMLGSPYRLQTLLRPPRGEAPNVQPFTRIALEPVNRIMERTRKAIEDDPSEPTYHYLLGRCHFARLEYDEAIEAFEEAIRRAIARSEPMNRALIDECREYQYRIGLLLEGRARIFEFDE